MQECSLRLIHRVVVASLEFVWCGRTRSLASVERRRGRSRLDEIMSLRWSFSCFGGVDCLEKFRWKGIKAVGVC